MKNVIIILIVLAALITPDGSGITMSFVAGLMLLLYVRCLKNDTARELYPERIVMNPSNFFLLQKDLFHG